MIFGVDIDFALLITFFYALTTVDMCLWYFNNIEFFFRVIS